MLNMRWSPEVTLEFVKVYLKHECLWNPDHEGYRSKHKREVGYQKVLAEAKGFIKDIDIYDVKTKIKNLRTTYSQQVNKIFNKSTDPDHIYQPSLYWFAEMDKYLKDISARRPSVHYDTWHLDSFGNEDDLRKEEKSDDPLVHDTDFNSDNFCSDNEDIKFDTQLSPQLPTINKTGRKKSKLRKRLHHSPDLLVDFSHLSKEPEEEDEFDIYGRYVASQLRNLSLNTALKMKVDIHNLLTEARISELL